jgi:hypothetical protein
VNTLIHYPVTSLNKRKKQSITNTAAAATTTITNNNNSIQLFIIYVPSQQLQGQLQTQHSVGTRIITVIQYKTINEQSQTML